MTVFCAHCQRQFPREAFDVRRRDRRRFVTGQRVLSALHRREARGCGMETEYPEGAALAARDKMTKTTSR